MITALRSRFLKMFVAGAMTVHASDALAQATNEDPAATVLALKAELAGGIPVDTKKFTPAWKEQLRLQAKAMRTASNDNRVLEDDLSDLLLVLGDSDERGKFLQRFRGSSSDVPGPTSAAALSGDTALIEALASDLERNEPGELPLADPSDDRTQFPASVRAASLIAFILRNSNQLKPEVIDWANNIGNADPSVELRTEMRNWWRINGPYFKARMWHMVQPGNSETPVSGNSDPAPVESTAVSNPEPSIPSAAQSLPLPTSLTKTSVAQIKNPSSESHDSLPFIIAGLLCATVAGWLGISLFRRKAT